MTPAGDRLDTRPGRGGRSFQLNVTDKDIQAGHIRVTREPKREPGFPQERSTLDINFGGNAMRVSWDPRSGPDQERSGLLRIGRAVAYRLITTPQTLVILRRHDGVIVFEKA